MECVLSLSLTVIFFSPLVSPFARLKSDLNTSGFLMIGPKQRSEASSGLVVIVEEKE